jgi:hypothetical protein
MPAPSVPSEPEVVVEEVKADSSEPMPSSSVKVPPSSGGIKVIAMRRGYFRGNRKEAGDQFVIGNMNKLGSWMKLADPKLEQERQYKLKAEKAAKAKKAEK